MAITSPWAESQKSPQEPENGPQWAPERARDHAGAGEYTVSEDSATTDNVSWGPWPTPQNAEGDKPQSTEVAVRPEPGTLAKLGDASKVWLAEAKETGAAAIDGSVLRARPPALRDMYTRMCRADWAGDITALRRAGFVFGWISLVITAIGYAVLWLAARPSRLAITTAIAVLVVVLAI